MQKTWRKENLDIVLVPVSLLIMFGYHLFLLYRYLRLPKTTVIGYENYNKRAWVERMMQVRISIKKKRKQGGGNPRLLFPPLMETTSFISNHFLKNVV